jgi:hypothetical protein
MMTATLVGLSAQVKPNFAGHWTLQTDPGRPAAAGRGDARGGAGGSGGAPFCGAECTITQDATKLTISRTAQVGEQGTEFRLDGTEMTAAIPAGQLAIARTTRATWNGSTLIIIITNEVAGNTTTARTELSLYQTGMLRVVRTLTPPGGDQVTTTHFYKRK